MSGITHMLLGPTVAGNISTSVTGLNSSASSGSVIVPQPWSVDGATLDQSFNFSPYPSFADGLIFNPTGTKAYFGGFTAESVTEWSLSTAWNISTMTVGIAKSLQVSGVPVTLSAVTGLYIDPAGRRLYILNNAGSPLDMHVYYYTMSSAFNLTSLTYVSRFSVNSRDSGMRYVFMKPDGTIMYTSGSNSARIWQWTLGTAWDVSTASYSGKSLLLSSQDVNPIGGLVFKPDGTRAYVIGTQNAKVYQYDLGTAWDVSTGSFTTSSPADTGTDGYGLFIKPDGTKLYSVNSSLDNIYQYSLYY